MSKIPNNKLSDLQNHFLIIYKNLNNVYQAIEESGITQAEFLDWQNEPAFDDAYREVTSQLTVFLLQQNTLLTRQRINEALQKGYVEEEQINVEYDYFIENKSEKPIYESGGLSKGTFDAKPLPHVKVNKTFKKKALSGAYLQTNGTENNLVKALQVLVQENVLPIQIARLLISQSNKISNQFLDIFTREDGKDQQIEDDKVIALIKSAVLGN